MGYSLSWLAFKGAAIETSLETLGLSKTTLKAEWGRKSVTGHALRDGWHLVIAPRCDHPLISESSLAALSKKAQVIACRIEEHVMFSSAEFWEHGKKVWCVEHDAQQSKRHLETEGALPVSYNIVVREATEQQDEEDQGPKEVDFYFEVPLQTAKEIAGFKHDDENASLDQSQFEVYASLSDPLGEGAARKWWQVWK
jgi:hypothetical protein